MNGKDELFPGGDSKYTIEALRDRLRELDEKNQTQAHCLAARAEKIGRLEDEVKRLSGENKTLEHRRRFSYRQQSKTYLSVLRLKREVRRLNRMVDKAIDRLEGGCCDAPQSFDCEESNRNCRDCWKERLESEVADNG